MEQNITISSNLKGVVKVIHAVQNDTGRELKISLDRSDLSSSMTFNAIIEKPSGLSCYIPATYDSTTNIISVELTNQALAEEGNAKAQIEVIDTDGVVTSYFFYIAIEKALRDDSTIESSNEFTALQAMENTIAQAKAQFDNAVSAVSTDTELTDIRVKADGTTATTAGNAVREQITALKEDLTELSDDIKKTKDAIYYVVYGKNRFNSDMLVPKKTIDAHGSYIDDDTMTSTKLIEINEVKLYAITSYNGVAKATYSQVFYDENKTFISRNRSNVTNVSIPVNAKYIAYVFNNTWAFDKLQIEFSDSTKNTSYEPFNDRIYINEDLYIDNVRDITGIKDSDMWVKEYGVDLIADARLKVLQKNTDVKCMNFAFATDIHVKDEAETPASLNTVKAINELAKQKFISFIANGGDIINAYESGREGNGIDLGEAVNRFELCLSQMVESGLPLYIAKGNHDQNVKLASSQRITDTMWEALITPYANGNDFSMSLGNYYVDYDKYKIRIIILNVYAIRNGEATTYKKEIGRWLINALTFDESKRDYHTLVISHNPMDNMDVILNAFVNGLSTSFPFDSSSTQIVDFSNQGAMPLIALLCGHTHEDNYDTTNGYNYITVASPYTLNNNTDESEKVLFSVFSIDTSNRKLYETRIGSGNDREFSY